MNEMNQYDCFISHASEDKEDFVSPLAMELRRLGVKVWFDKFELKVGDSLSRRIDEGLSNSRFGIVVLSQAFFAKAWPEYELRGLVAREIGRKKVILPVWYNVSKDQVLSFSPPLADKLAIHANGNEVRVITRSLIEVIRPDIFEQLHRIEALQIQERALPVQRIPISQIEFDQTIRHPKLTPQQMVRIRNVHYILKDAYEEDLGATIVNFKRDMNVNSEIWIWEGMAAAYSSYKDATAAPLEELREVFSALLIMSMGMIDEVMTKGGYDFLTPHKLDILLEIWSKVTEEVVFVPSR